jgi:hypothetical protein
MQWAEEVLGVNQQPELPNLPPGWYYQDSSNPDDIIAINRNNHEQTSGFCETHEQAAARAWKTFAATRPEPESAPQEPIDVDQELERLQQEKKKDEKAIKGIEERLRTLMGSYHDIQRCLYDLGWMTDKLHNRTTAHGYLMRRQGIAMSLTKDIARYTKDVTLKPEGSSDG